MVYCTVCTIRNANQTWSLITRAILWLNISNMQGTWIVMSFISKSSFLMFPVFSQYVFFRHSSLPIKQKVTTHNMLWSAIVSFNLQNQNALSHFGTIVLSFSNAPLLSWYRLRVAQTNEHCLNLRRKHRKEDSQRIANECSILHFMNFVCKCSHIGLSYIR